MAHRLVRFGLNTVVIVMLLAPFEAGAQEKEAKPYPDIGIMNSILRELMQVPYGTHDRIEVYGSFLPTFGLLFVVNPPDKLGFNWDFSALDSTMAELSKKMSHFDSQMTQFGTPAPGHKVTVPRVVPFKEPFRPPTRKENKDTNNYSAGQYDAVMKFLESYVDAENRLLPAQRIGVVVLSDGESPARFFEVSKKTIDEYRSGGRDGAQFKQYVHVSTVQEKGEDNSISIMTTILDKSLGESSHGEGIPFLTSNDQGVYVKGLGALFICRPSTPYFSDKSLYLFKREHLDITQLEEKTIRVLGNYGVSLRFLPENESIMVFLNLDPFGRENVHLLISLKKRDIDLYTRDEIDFKTLQQRATVIQDQ